MSFERDTNSTKNCCWPDSVAANFNSIFNYFHLNGENSSYFDKKLQLISISPHKRIFLLLPVFCRLHILDGPLFFVLHAKNVWPDLFFQCFKGFSNLYIFLVFYFAILINDENGIHRNRGIFFLILLFLTFFSLFSLSPLFSILVLWTFRLKVKWND